MTRTLFVTTVASVVSIAAASSLLAAPVVNRAEACESHWFVVSGGNCPTNIIDYCEEEVAGCGFNSRYSTCNESPGDGFALYCQVA